MAKENIIEIATKHFDGMRGKTVTIPEWGTAEKPFVGKYDPPTLGTRQNIERRAMKSQGRQMAITLILCLRDLDGDLVFKDDAPTLQNLMDNVDPKVVARVAQVILQILPEDDLGN